MNRTIVCAFGFLTCNNDDFGDIRHALFNGLDAPSDSWGEDRYDGIIRARRKTGSVTKDSMFRLIVARAVFSGTVCGLA